MHARKPPLPHDAPEMRILIVDDEPAVRTSLERALSLEGYDVDLAGRWRRGTRPAGRRAARRRGPRREHARARRPRGLPAHAPGRRPHAGAHAHRARRSRRPRRGPRRRRRRLPGQAVRAARAAGAAARPAAPRRSRRRRPALRRPHAGPRRARGPPRRRARIDLSRTEFTLLELFMRHPRQVLTRTQIFEAVWGYDLGATSNALGVYMGYLRRKTEAGRRAAPAAHGPRRRLRAARGLIVALRARLTLMSALIVGVTLVLASLVAYAAVRGQQRGQVDDALRGNAAFYQGLAARAGAACRPGVRASAAPPPSLGGPGGYAQLVRPNGNAIELGPARRPAAAGDRARRSRPPTASPTEASPIARRRAAPARAHRRAWGPIGAVQVARSLEDADRVLDAPAARAHRARGRRHRARGRREPAVLAARRRAGDRADRGGRAHRGHRRPRPARRRRRPRRGRAHGRALQRDARAPADLAAPSSASSSPTPRTSCARR